MRENNETFIMDEIEAFMSNQRRSRKSIKFLTSFKIAKQKIKKIYSNKELNEEQKRNYSTIFVYGVIQKYASFLQTAYPKFGENAQKELRNRIISLVALQNLDNMIMINSMQTILNVNKKQQQFITLDL